MTPGCGVSAADKEKLVLAISSRALFDLDEENLVFEEQGLEAYRKFQVEREDSPLGPGTAFPLIRALLAINDAGKGELVEVVLLSRNDVDTGLRVMNSADRHGLLIHRACFTGGRPPFGYLSPLSCDLFLSAHEDDVRAALAAGRAAALVYRPPTGTSQPGTEVRIALDGDAVLFASNAETVYRERGLVAFHEQERLAAGIPLDPGPFQGFLLALHAIQKRFPADGCPIRTALVTARSVPAHKRAIHTLREWQVRVDEAFFLGGMDKSGVLEQFQPHIYIDDHPTHCQAAASRMPTARVPSLADLTQVSTESTRAVDSRG